MPDGDTVGRHHRWDDASGLVGYRNQLAEPEATKEHNIMATPRKPRTRKPANTIHIDLVPAAPKPRRGSRKLPTYIMERRPSVQHAPRDADWVRTRIVEATVEELSNVSLVDAATIIRAAINGQPINPAPVARLAVLGLWNLGLTVYDYLSPPADAPPPGTR